MIGLMQWIFLGKKRQAADPNAPKADRIPFPKMLVLSLASLVFQQLHIC